MLCAHFIQNNGNRNHTLLYAPQRQGGWAAADDAAQRLLKMVVPTRGEGGKVDPPEVVHSGGGIDGRSDGVVDAAPAQEGPPEWKVVRKKVRKAKRIGLVRIKDADGRVVLLSADEADGVKVDRKGVG